MPNSWAAFKVKPKTPSETMQETGGTSDEALLSFVIRSWSEHNPSTDMVVHKAGRSSIPRWFVEGKPSEIVSNLKSSKLHYAIVVELCVNKSDMKAFGMKKFGKF